MPNELATNIIKVLEGVASPLLARSAVAAQCKRLNITTETVSTAHIDQICQGLQLGLSGFGFDISNILPKIKSLIY